MSAHGTNWQGDALFILHLISEQFLADFFELCQIRAATQDRVTIKEDDIKYLLRKGEDIT